jgi:hypothetical protein
MSKQTYNHKRAVQFANDPPDTLYSPPLAAEYCSQGLQQLSIRIRKGTGPKFIRLGKRSRVFRKEWLDEYLNRHTITPKTDK